MHLVGSMQQTWFACIRMHVYLLPCDTLCCCEDQHRHRVLWLQYSRDLISTNTSRRTLRAPRGTAVQYDQLEIRSLLI